MEPRPLEVPNLPAEDPMEMLLFEEDDDHEHRPSRQVGMVTQEEEGSLRSRT